MQPPPAWLMDGDERVPVDGGVLIGRAADATVVIEHDDVSRHHARVAWDGHGHLVEDLGSTNGTQLNDRLLRGEEQRLLHGDRLVIGDRTLRFEEGGTRRQETTFGVSPQAPVALERVAFEGARLRIGRDESNNVVLRDPNVSRFHAEVVRDGEGLVLADLGSRNGTRLNGEPVRRAPVRPSDRIGIGPYAVTLDGGGTAAARDERGSLRLEAAGLAVRAGAKQILAPLSLALEPGEFVVIIGESGAGKSTLLKALAGVTRPTAGAVTASGEPLSARSADIGYVPQDEIVHGLLTVHEALTYAARLRLPQDLSAEEIGAAVDAVMAELSLAEHAGTRVQSLSGGQRKRVGAGVELVSRPGLLLLDEPTSGLDPGLETKMMELMRELADGSRTVVLVTHTTANLALCDRLVVMGRGGELTFHGRPEAALAFFGVGDYDQIYTALAATPAVQWRRRFEGGARAPASERAPAAPRAARRRPKLLPQVTLLTGRYLKLLARDRRNLAILLGQVPLLALAVVGLFRAGVFERPDGRPGDAVALVFLLFINAVWLGAIDTARELVRERSVFVREAAIGTRLSAYLTSKLVVLLALVTVQCLVLAGITLALRPLEAPLETYLAVVGVLVLSGFVAAAMGLLISAAVGSDDQAISITPLAIIPQLLFAGSQVPVERMAEPVQSISTLVFGRWALATNGTSLDFNERFAESPEFAAVNRFGTDFFTVSLPEGILVLGLFLLAFLAGVVVLLRRQIRA